MFKWLCSKGTRFCRQPSEASKGSVFLLELFYQIRSHVARFQAASQVVLLFWFALASLLFVIMGRDCVKVASFKKEKNTYSFFFISMMFLVGFTLNWKQILGEFHQHVAVDKQSSNQRSPCFSVNWPASWGIPRFTSEQIGSCPKDSETL